MDQLPHNLYDILNIPPGIIFDKEYDVHYWLTLSSESTDPNVSINYLCKAIEITNKFHCYFHFEQSYAYIVCSYIYYLKKDIDLKTHYISKSIFQDHINHYAIEFESLIEGGHSVEDQLYILMSYNKNYRYERDFLRFAIGDFQENIEIELLDKGLKAQYDKDIKRAKKILSCITYKSHRIEITKSIINILESNYDTALEAILKTLQQMENAHQLYHEFASEIYMTRSKKFTELNQLDLAKNDEIKAYDLFPQRKLLSIITV